MPSITYRPCDDQDCKQGKIIVHDAYAANPLVGQEQTCDLCGGRGVIVDVDSYDN